MRIIRAADCKTMPWKNGGGTTTEIAVFPAGAPLSDFDWRVSMAHVGADGPFSAFPGIDRTLSVLGGTGITLAFGDGEAVTLDRASPPCPFAADRPVDGVLTDGPIDDLNVMTRRGRFSHRVRKMVDAGAIAVAPGEILILVAASDGWTVQAGERLNGGDSAVIEVPGTVSIAGGDKGPLFAVSIVRV